MKNIITIENLSKKYMLGHQQQERYTALRDVFANSAKNFFKKLYPSPKTPTINPLREEFWALKDVNIEIQQGERVGIIGRNGAGKSTFLKTLARITEPTTGRIKIHGRLASLLEVGTGFHPELTGRENIYLNGAILGMRKSEIHKKFDEIVSFAEVEKFLDTPVKRYSSGMYVRLAFAVAAHLETETLIIDEVLAVGDVQFQKKCMGRMKEVGAGGRTLLFVSHNMSAIRALCNRIIILDGGKVTFDGDANRGIEKYLNFEGKRDTTKMTISDNFPRIGNGRAKLIEVEIMDQKGFPISSLNFSQLFQIAFSFEIFETLNDEIMSMVYIVTSEGTRFGLTYNVVHGKAGWRLNKTQYRIVVEIDAVLLPFLNYRFDIGLFNRSGTECYDFVEQLLGVEVYPTEENGTDNYPGAQSHAYIRVAGKWHEPYLLK